MKVTEAIDSRMSCRAFTKQPVAIATIRQILDVARRAPSGGNLQPWHVHVLGGERLREFRGIVKDRLKEKPGGEGTEYPVYPPNLTEPYRSRRFKCGEDMYGTVGIARENRSSRAEYFARNFDFFGAPLALFFSIDRQMGAPQWSDVGMFMQNIMLLAREHGLHTCPQEAWALWHKTVGDFLPLAPNLMLFSGMAIGYRDESAAVNRLRTDRAAIDDFVTFVTAEPLRD
jgi:nitroreductase